MEPSHAPSGAPSEAPAESPTAAPYAEPTEEPTAAPNAQPTGEPSEASSTSPTETPSEGPTTAQRLANSEGHADLSHHLNKKYTMSWHCRVFRRIRLYPQKLRHLMVHPIFRVTSWIRRCASPTIAASGNVVQTSWTSRRSRKQNIILNKIWLTSFACPELEQTKTFCLWMWIKNGWAEHGSKYSHSYSEHCFLSAFTCSWSWEFQSFFINPNFVTLFIFTKNTGFYGAGAKWKEQWDKKTIHVDLGQVS